MSAEHSHELQEACNKILRRLQTHGHQSRPCFLCGVFVVGGEERLAEHLSQRHGAVVCPFGNVVDLDGFLDCLKRRMDLDKRLQCPVCLESVGPPSAVEALRQHLQQACHAEWNPHTIPELAEFYLPVALEDASINPEGNGKLAKADEGSEEDIDDEERHRGRNDVDPDGAEEALLGSDDEDWNDACVCLYCPTESTECLEHMTCEHSFDLRMATRSREDVKDEYDIIRLINAVRRSVAEGKCPYAYGATEALEPCALGGSLEEHLLQFPEHRLPKTVPLGSDAELIPVLQGDGLISLAVTAGEGFLRDEAADPEFPMAPTLQEVAAYGIAKEKKEKKAAKRTK